MQAPLRERILNRLARIDPTRREITLATLFLAVLFGLGTLGYHLLEGWSWVDGLYMTFITLTTIGFTEVGPLSVAGRFFTIGIAVAGIGLVAFIATRTAQMLLTGQDLRQRRLRRLIDRMENHFIIVGHGRIGKRIVDDLERAQHRAFVVVDRKASEIDAMEAAGIPHLEGDAEDEEVLLRAGVRRARGLILTLPEDSANVFITLSARELNPDLFILARTNDYKNRRKLMHAGANKVIAPIEIGGDRMAQVILRPYVDLFMEQVFGTGALALQMDEVRIEPGAPLAGKSLAESNFRQEFDAIVVAIVDSDTQEMTYNPGPNHCLQPGDVLIVMGSEAMIQGLRKRGCTAG